MIKTVGVIGCGQMGAGIAEVIARSGADVVVVEADESALGAGKSRLASSFDRALSKGKITQQEHEQANAKLSFSADLSSLANCDLIIEAIVEDEAAKSDLFGRLNDIVSSSAVFASNTSSIPIARLGEASHRSERFVGMHFFNPVPIMPVVEVIRSEYTSNEVAEVVEKLVTEQLGKTVVHGPDRAGFIVNALLIPYLLSSIRFYEQGLATKEDIDTAMELGCNLPMGPLRLSDFIGLDTVENIANVIHDSLGDDTYEVPSLLHEMIEHGQLGKKSGRGFYDYE